MTRGSVLPISVARPASTSAAACSDSKSPSLFVTSPPPSPTLKTPTVRTRLSKLCQDGHPHLARQLFETISRPSTALWNTIIIGFVCNNLPFDAILFYARMKSSSPHPLIQCDAYTYSSMFKACAETESFTIGKAVHCHLLRCSSQSSRIAYNSLLNMYSCMDCIRERDDKTRNVFDSMTKRDVVSWNILISWYVKTQRYTEAVRNFRKMIRMGVEPSPISFVNCFPAVAGAKDLKFLHILYGMLVKLGNNYIHDMFIVSSVILAFAEFDRLDYARKVFDSCLNKNTEVWNTMIGGYVHQNYFVEAVNLFLEAIQVDPMVADEVTFLHALTAVSLVPCIELARQLHAFVIKFFGTLPVALLNAIMVMYSRCNSINKSSMVFDGMVERDVVSWNTIISSFINNDLNDEGLMLVHEMQKQRFEVDSVTIAAILSASSNLRNADIGKQTHAYLFKHNIILEGIESYLIDMYSKSGLVVAAKHVFHQSDVRTRDQATWNAMIACNSQHGMVQEALSTVAMMVKHNVFPTPSTITSILPACCKWGNKDLGKQLHGVSIRLSLDQNVFLSTALVDMYSKTGSIEDAEHVFLQSKEKNSITYTTMIMGYGHHGMGDKALSLFRSMARVGIEPDAITLTAVLSACSYSGLVDEGLQIFKSMETLHKIQPTAQHFCCVADMLGRAKRVSEAYEFVKQLGAKGNVMEIWGAVLSACRLYGDAQMAEEIARRMVELECPVRSPGHRVLLSNIYAEEGDWSNVDGLRKQMREKGIRKEIGCSWIDVGGSVAHFVSKDEGNPKRDQILDMLESVIREMRDNFQEDCVDNILLYQ